LPRSAGLIAIPRSRGSEQEQRGRRDFKDAGENTRCSGIISGNNFSPSRETIADRRDTNTRTYVYTRVFCTMTIMDSRSLSVRSAEGTVRNYNPRECFTTPPSIL